MKKNDDSIRPQPPTPDLQSRDRMVALSIRQPYAEMILRGVKPIEFRSMPTRKRERVYIYASKIPADDQKAWEAIGAEPGDFTVGRLVGTVEIIACSGRPGDFHWHLARPQRLDEPLPVRNKPQPMFFYPF